MFDLLIFDCDGVLVDTEVATNQAICDYLRDLGASITLEETMARYLGRAIKETMHVTRDILQREPPADFYEEFVRRRNAALLIHTVEIPHIREALSLVSLPYCVASGAERDKMRLTLGKTNLLHHFEGRMFGSDMVARSKPAPDVYLLAAKTLGVDPKRCLVVEDSPTGASAGVAAGMTVLGYCQHTDPHALLKVGASAVFNDMRRLPFLTRR